MKLVGFERIVPYVDGGDTGEVAEKLEKHYKVFERFAEDVKDELKDKFLFYLKRYIDDKNPQAFQESCRLTSLWLTDRWRTYIEHAEHGMRTNASDLRGDPAFIDTTFFYKNTLWEIQP